MEVDKLTGQVSVLDYMAVVDCGIPINPALAHAIYRATGVWHRSLPITRRRLPWARPCLLKKQKPPRRKKENPL